MERDVPITQLKFLIHLKERLDVLCFFFEKQKANISGLEIEEELKKSMLWEFKELEEMFYRLKMELSGFLIGKYGEDK